MAARNHSRRKRRNGRASALPLERRRPLDQVLGQLGDIRSLFAVAVRALDCIVEGSPHSPDLAHLRCSADDILPLLAIVLDRLQSAIGDLDTALAHLGDQTRKGGGS